MRKLTLTALISLAPMAASAGVDVHIELGLPVAPRLVIVAPGVQVVEGVPDEVFFHNGWYWCRRSDGWYRARHPREHFYWVDRRRVPRPLFHRPEGHYRNWRHAEPRPRNQGQEMRRHRAEERMERREERSHDRRERREDRREDRENRREERRGRHVGHP